MIRKIKEYIGREKLLEQNGRYLVALSGGADSVALMRVLCTLGYRIEAVHCNFHLRGEESDRDERFCQELCAAMDVPFHTVHFDTLSYAELHHVSIEMAARELRYDYFEQLRRDISADAVCVAHHRDDSIETLLLNLIRGTGLHGLRGISPKNGNILRPLLCVSRTEIEEFLRSENQSFVTDSTNNEDDAVRNRIRHHVLPLLETINPSVRQSLADTAAHLAAADKMMLAALGDAKESVMTDEGTISVAALAKELSPEYVLFHILSAYLFSSDTIEEIARYVTSDGAKTSGRQWLSVSHRLVLDRGTLLISTRNGNLSFQMRIPETGTYCFTDADGKEQKLRVELTEWQGCMTVSREQSCVMLDAARVTFPLILRYASRGDRFVPFGMNGTKLVSDFLTDQKRTIIEKERQLVVENANGDIIWLVNNRPDNRYRITAQTQKVMSLSMTYDL